MSIQTLSPVAPLLTEHAVAELIGTSRRFLQKHRAAGTGPRYLKLSGRDRGGAVRYRLSDVEKWLESKEAESTHEAKHKTTAKQ